MDLSIEGKFFLKGNFENCCIGIKEGKIVKIKKILKSENHKYFRNNIILPAGIDIHVHFREPGMTDKEDLSTGSKSAAFGGISCYFDMPNTIPQSITKQNLFLKKKLAENKSYVDFGLYFGITNNNINKLSEIKKYCSGFKLYMGESTNSMNFDNHNLDALKNCDIGNKALLIHAEDQECINKNKKMENNLNDHNKSRPSICELNAVRNIKSVFQNSNKKIHICHITSSKSVDEIKNLKNFTCGVTPHHLLLDIENVSKKQNYYKVNPPIRKKLERKLLLDCLIRNEIDVVESDHAPHTINQKNTDFDSAPSGIPGVETMIPIFLYLVKNEVITMNQFIQLFCKNPAEILKIPKGQIKIGYDADFMIVDLKKITKIEANNLHYKCGWSPFENFKTIFPKHLFIRGENIISDWEMVSKEGFGKFVGG